MSPLANGPAAAGLVAAHPPKGPSPLGHAGGPWEQKKHQPVRQLTPEVDDAAFARPGMAPNQAAITARRPLMAGAAAAAQNPWALPPIAGKVQVGGNPWAAR